MISSHKLRVESIPSNSRCIASQHVDQYVIMWYSSTTLKWKSWLKEKYILGTDKKVFGAGKYPQLPKTLREIPLSGQRADLLFRVVEGEVREISQIRQHRFCKPKKSDWPVKKNTEKKFRWGDFKAFIVSGTTSVPPFHCLASNTNLVITEQIIWMDIGSRWSCLLWTDGVCHAITCS